MERIIRKLSPSATVLPKKKRVAAYARVSSGKDAMLHSLSAQVSYYSNYIQKHKEWQYIGVYADEAITGTKDTRAEFQRLLADCRAGLIDMVITKSISRFAWNTVTMLETVRELKNLNVDVFFEKENIHSISGDGELMLTILASFAQEESPSVSENCKWRIRKGFKEGRPSCASMLGYRMKADALVVVPEEAKIVKMIFDDYLSGMSKNAIVKKLISQGYKGKRGGQWDLCDITTILTNEKYAGNMLLQKTFISDHIAKRKQKNDGQLAKYYIADSHEPIITPEVFERVQNMIQEEKSRYQPPKKSSERKVFLGKIICGQCGKTYRYKISNASTKYEKAVWICPTFNSLGKKHCPSQQIPEDILISIANEVLELKAFDKAIFDQQIKEIRILEPNRLAFVFDDNRIVEKSWMHKSRKESWSDEDRQKARESRLIQIRREH